MSAHSFQAPSSQNHALFKLVQPCCKLIFFLWVIETYILTFFQTAVKSSKLDFKKVKEERKLTRSIDWNSLPPLPKPKKEDMHDKWMVVTTISAPTDDIKKLAKVEGWKLLVVGDKKTPKDWQ